MFCRWGLHSGAVHSLRLLLIPGTTTEAMDCTTMESPPTEHTDLDITTLARGRLRPSLRLLLIPGTTTGAMDCTTMESLHTGHTDLDITTLARGRLRPSLRLLL